MYSNWVPVTVDEMKAFIAVILNMGIIQLKNLKDYWISVTYLIFDQCFHAKDFAKSTTLST